MPRRIDMPAADELFRRTGEDPKARKVRAVPDNPDADPAPPEKRGPSGRIKHDEKMTVYVTSDELLDLEHARLSLRKDQGLAVDRGRLVRAAMSLVLADYEEHGEASALVRRLTEE